MISWLNDLRTTTNLSTQYMRATQFNMGSYGTLAVYPTK